MDYNSVQQIKNGIKIKSVNNFELEHIFDCGQCFRWHKKGDAYIGVAFGKVIEIEKKNEDVYIYNTSVEEFYSIWEDYFDLKRDYSIIKNELREDTVLDNAIDFGYGIRLLKQDPFEIIVSFIISSNNRIPMIKRAIENISKSWGEPIEYKGNVYYTFPQIDVLKDVTEEELKVCGLGFRSKYVKNTVQKLYESEKNETYDYDNIEKMIKMDDDNCHEALQKFSGIGPKVADCIMLFSMSKYSAFPVDVWVKRAMQHFYVAPDVSLKKIREFGREKFGVKSGFAQQYLFYYTRENGIVN